MRGFNTYGPRQKYGAKGAVIARFIKAALEDADLLIYGDGEQTRDYTYVKDFAEGIVTAHLSWKTGHELIVLATGIEHQINDIASRIITLTNSSSTIKHVDKRPAENLRSCGDASKALNLLGWSPKTKFENGLIQTILYYRRQA
jgi:nucleoside-diphosphate-sugar epimerase